MTCEVPVAVPKGEPPPKGVLVAEAALLPGLFVSLSPEGSLDVRLQPLKTNCVGAEAPAPPRSVSMACAIAWQ